MACRARADAGDHVALQRDRAAREVEGAVRIAKVAALGQHRHPPGHRDGAAADVQCGKIGLGAAGGVGGPHDVGADRHGATAQVDRVELVVVQRRRAAPLVPDPQGRGVQRPLIEGEPVGEHRVTQPLAHAEGAEQQIGAVAGQIDDIGTDEARARVLHADVERSPPGAVGGADDQRAVTGAKIDLCVVPDEGPCPADVDRADVQQSRVAAQYQGQHLVPAAVAQREGARRNGGVARQQQGGGVVAGRAGSRVPGVADQEGPAGAQVDVRRRQRGQVHRGLDPAVGDGIARADLEQAAIGVHDEAPGPAHDQPRRGWSGQILADDHIAIDGERLPGADGDDIGRRRVGAARGEAAHCLTEVGQ